MVLLAKDIVEKDFLSLPRGTSAFEAAKQMNSSQRGFVIVVGADGRPEGIVTEWDYLSKLVAEEKDPSKTRLEDIMSTGLVTVKADDGIDFYLSDDVRAWNQTGSCHPRWQRLGRYNCQNGAE